jgi:hypothetical protein
MDIQILAEGEGLSDATLFILPDGSTAGSIIAAISAKTGIPASESLLFAEDGTEPISATEVAVSKESAHGLFHVHRARQIAVTVNYSGGSKEKEFTPATRVQVVLDWAVGRDGFNIDPAIAPEMELALQGQTTPLPRQAHIGRFVRHPAHELKLDLIRGVIPNGECV